MVMERGFSCLDAVNSGLLTHAAKKHVEPFKGWRIIASTVHKDGAECNIRLASYCRLFVKSGDTLQCMTECTCLPCIAQSH